MTIELVVVGDREFFMSLERRHPMFALADALDDIGEEIHHQSIVSAPKGKTGELSIHGVGRDRVMPVSPSIVRGSVGLRRRPEHGVWVHEGTGLFGRFHRPFFSPRGNVMRFRTDEGRWISRRFIRGQEPQPFFRDVVLAAEHTYVPARIRKLVLDIKGR